MIRLSAPGLELRHRWWLVLATAAACSGYAVSVPAELAGGTAVGAGAVVAEATAEPVPAPLAVLTLRQCVEIALRSNLATAIAEEQRQSAVQGLKGAWGAFLPAVSVGRTYSKNERRDFDVPVTEARLLYQLETVGGDIIDIAAQVPTGEVYDQKIVATYQDISADASLNLFDGHRKYGTLKSSRQVLRAAEATASYTREQVVENVAAAYFDLLRYERLLEVAVESRDLAARELERTEVYFKLGSAAKSDVLQAKVRYEQTRLEVVRAENGVEQAFANLAYAMNQPLAARFEIERSALDANFELADLDALYAQALAQRLDLRSREHEVEARKGEVTAAGSGLWPSLDVFLSYTRYTNESPYRFGAQESDNIGYGYRVNWNIFDRLQSWTGRNQAKARARMAVYNLEQSRLDAQLEVRRLYNSLVEARERARVSRETIVQAEEELRLAQERFRVGAGTTLDRINAQVNLTRARADEVQAICDYLINAARLDRAVGRASEILEAGS